MVQLILETTLSVQSVTVSGCMQEEHLPNTLRQVGTPLTVLSKPPTGYCLGVSTTVGHLLMSLPEMSCSAIPDAWAPDDGVLQVLIYQALGFKEPAFGHVSLILAPDKSKLSKRHGATSVGEFREQGYLPEAMINYLSLLGWNDGTEQACSVILPVLSFSPCKHAFPKQPCDNRLALPCHPGRLVCTGTLHRKLQGKH